MSGSVSFHAGLSAEHIVARHYVDRGFEIAETRFRASSGEIDLIAEKAGRVVFIEVKKSRTHAAAAQRLNARQMARIYATASEYLGRKPSGQDTPSQFDVGLVDSEGRVEILENAFAA